MLKNIDIRRSRNKEHNSCLWEISNHRKHLVTDARGTNGECCMMSMQLTDRIVTKIKNGYYKNELFPFADLSRNKLERSEIQNSRQ